MKLTARRIWLSIHRWLGLTAGLLFVLIGLTGSLLVFDHAIDEWLNPDLLLTNGTGSRRSIAEVIAAGENGFVGPPTPALSVTKPRVENGVWTVWFSTGTKDEPQFTAVHVDPYSAKVTGQRVWGEDLMSWIYRLHFRLLAGTTGGIIVGVFGILMLISVGSGISLWWPLFRNSWRAAFAVRGGKRFNYDLHKLVGIGSAAFLLVIAFTGVYMEFPEWFKSAVASLSEATPPPEGLKSGGDSTKEAITPDEAIAIAETHFPNAQFDHLHPPQGSEGVYEVAFRQAGEVQKSFGRTQVFMDQYTGEIVARRDPDDFTAADTFFAWQFPLHNGEAFGLVGRCLVFVMGLVPAVLYITGLTIWWRKRGGGKTTG